MSLEYKIKVTQFALKDKMIGKEILSDLKKSNLKVIINSFSYIKDLEYIINYALDLQNKDISRRKVDKSFYDILREEIFTIKSYD